MTGGADLGRFSARRGLVLGFGGAAVLVAGVAAWSVLASVSGAVIASGWRPSSAAPTPSPGTPISPPRPLPTPG